MNSIRNNGNDDKTLDQDLQDLDQQYQRMESDEPPELLDQAILNRAHRAVESKNSWLDFGWIHGLTTVGLLVLTLSVVVSMRESGQFDPTTAPLNDQPLAQPVERQRNESVGELKARDEPEADFHLSEEVSAPSVSRDSVRANVAAEPEPPAAPAARLTVDSISAEIAEDQANTEMSAEVGSTAKPEAIGQAIDESRQTRAKKENNDRESEGASENRADATSGQDTSAARDQLPQKSAAYLDELVVDADNLARPYPYQDLDLAQQAELIAIILKHKQADNENWKEELEAFKKAYPDYPLPEELNP